MPATDTAPNREQDRRWPWPLMSEASEGLRLDVHGPPGVQYHRDSLGHASPRSVGFVVDTYSVSFPSDDPSLFLTWSSSGPTSPTHTFGRLASLVDAIQSLTVPDASEELWGLIDRATELRRREPRSDDEIEEWANQLANQVIDADD